MLSSVTLIRLWKLIESMQSSFGSESSNRAWWMAINSSALQLISSVSLGHAVTFWIDRTLGINVNKHKSRRILPTKNHMVLAIHMFLFLKHWKILAGNCWRSWRGREREILTDQRPIEDWRSLKDAGVVLLWSNRTAGYLELCKTFLLND